MNTCAAIAVVVLLATPGSSQIFVSPAGDDGGPGTLAQPFATLERAQSEVRTLRRADPGRGVVVMLRGGVYRLERTLLFRPEDGGDESHEVVWSAMPGEDVTVSGGRVIRGWVQEEEGLFRAPLPPELSGKEVRDLYLGTARLPRARHPDEGWLRVGEAGEDRRTSFRFDPGAVPEIEDAAGLEVHLLHDWSSSRVPVAELDAAAGSLRTRARLGCAAPHYAIDNFEPHPRFALEGHPALLDAPGEWCQDPRTGELLLKPPPWLEEDPTWIADPGSMRLEVPVLERLLEVRGEPDRPVRNLAIIGLRFRQSAFRPPSNGWAGAQASMYERRDGGDRDTQRVFVPAAVRIEDALDCSLEACTLSALGGSAVWVGPGCRDVALWRCTIRNVGANGINIGEDGRREVSGQPWWRSSAPEDPRLARRITVEGCTILDAGRVYPGSVGIWIGFAADCRVAFNDIHDLPYTGVSVGWVWGQDPSPCRGHRIENNDIYRVMQLLSDGGCIYTLGRQPGTSLLANHLHALEQQAGRAPSNGIFMDEGSSEILVEGNLIHDISQAPIRFHRAGRNLIAGNVLITPREDPYQYNRTDPADIERRGNEVRPELRTEDMTIERASGARGLRSERLEAERKD